MQVNNNLNSMIQLEKKLEKSANALSKLNLDSEQTQEKSQKNLGQKSVSQDKGTQEPDIAKEMIKQIEIPIAYTANAEVISTQDAVHKTIIDIKA